MKLTAAAWVPERRDEDWDVAAAAAAAWVHERARDEGSTPVLVTAVFQSYGPTIDDLARRYPHTTPQARDRHREAGRVGGFNWSSQHLEIRWCAMYKHERVAAVRQMRGKMWSPGRPSTARREDRVRFWGRSPVACPPRTLPPRLGCLPR